MNKDIVIIILFQHFLYFSWFHSQLNLIRLIVPLHSTITKKGKLLKVLQMFYALNKSFCSYKVYSSGFRTFYGNNTIR